MMRTGLPLLGIELLTFVLFRSLTVLNVQPPGFFSFSPNQYLEIGLLEFFLSSFFFFTLFEDESSES